MPASCARPPGWTTTTRECRQRGSSDCAAACAWPCPKRRRWPAPSAKDWDTLLQQMQVILATEGEVALFIGQQFRRHANNARSAGQNGQKTKCIHDALAAFRTALIVERQHLIQRELELFTLV